MFPSVSHRSELQRIFRNGSQSPAVPAEICRNDCWDRYVSREAAGERRFSHLWLSSKIVWFSREIRSVLPMKVTFRKLQDIVDHPSDSFADVNRAECTVIYQLLAFIPKSQRSIHGELTLRTTQLNHVLLKTAVSLNDLIFSSSLRIWQSLTERDTLQETFKRLAERYKTHFETEIQRDVASFEESRIQDLLVITTRDPSQSFRALQRDFQQVWDQRLSHLLERRGQYLQVRSMRLLFSRFRSL